MKNIMTIALVAVLLLTCPAAEGDEPGVSFVSKPVIVAFAGEGYEYEPVVEGAEGARFALTRAPEGMAINARTGKVTWTPSHNRAPYQQVALQVEAGGKTATQEFEVHILGLNDSQVGAMKKVNAGFTGIDHSFAGFGDSITVSFAWVLDMTWREQDHRPSWNKSAGYVFTDRGPEHCSQGGWRVTNATGDLEGKCKPTVIEYALTHDKPEVATIMYGTNGAVNVPTEEYATKLAFIVDKCLEHHCIPILCVPTRYTWKKQDGEMFDATRFFPEIRRIAQERNLPIISLHHLFENEPNPLSLFGDGVHPNNHGEETPYRLNDRSAGYNIINHAVYTMYRHLIDRGVIDDVPR